MQIINNWWHSKKRDKNKKECMLIMKSVIVEFEFVLIVMGVNECMLKKITVWAYFFSNFRENYLFLKLYGL